jgi:aminoglycoside phosphotransferase (APT) family kinase protein
MELTFELIKKRFEAEAARRPRLTSTDRLPIAYEEITPEWMTAALAKHFPGHEVASCRFSEPDEGTSSRRRIFLEWKTSHPSLPKSVFCKGSLHLENRYMIGLNGGIEAEATFYRVVRPRLEIEAPEPYFVGFDPETLNSIIVMRDLGEEAKFCWHTPPATRPQAESQMRLLATLHAAFWESAELATTLAGFRTWENYFTITVEKAGFGDACPRGFTEAEDVIPPRLFRRAAEVWPATLRSVLLHSTMPRTLVHSDVHLKNWFVAKSGEMGLNDWQCSCKGNWGRDLAYAISTALAVEDRRAWEKDLLRYYLDRLHAAGGPKLELDAAFVNYRQQLFNALSWWTGTLGQPPEAPKMQPPETSRVFIQRMTHAIDDLDALDAFV